MLDKTSTQIIKLGNGRQKGTDVKMCQTGKGAHQNNGYYRDRVMVNHRPTKLVISGQYQNYHYYTTATTKNLS